MKKLFDGRYTTTAVLGQGGMGKVYLAENTALGTKWAIKEVKKSVEVKQDLLAEPNILKKLNHPLLPRIVDIAEDDENIYIVMDYIEGTPLNKLLANGNHVSESQALKWFKNLCDVLIYLHNQKPNPIIYRDMKPSNIIITPDETAKVIDFGISREFNVDKTSDTQYMGTYGYAPPEQWAVGQTDHRADIYSLGVTVYQMITGKSPNEPPYEFRPIRKLNSEASEGLEYIINKCIQPDPANRYQSAEELLWDIENIYLYNSAYKKKKMQRRMLIAFEVLCAILGIGAAVYGAVNIPKEQTALYMDCVEKGNTALDDYDFTSAEKWYDTAIDFRKENVEAYIGKAQILYKCGDVDKCSEYLQSVAAELPPFSDNPDYNYLIGTIFFEKKDYESSVNYLSKSALADAENTTYTRDLAVAYARNGELEKAEELVNKLQSSNVSEDINTYVGAELHEAKHEYDDAISGYEQALDLTDSEEIKYKCFKSLSDLYLELRHSNPDNWDYIKAQIEVLERAQKELKNKNNLVLNEALAEAYFVGQRYDMAVNEFTELLNMGYERDYIYRNIAIIYQNQNNFDNAQKWLNEMQQKYPDNYLCYVQQCYLNIEKENQKESSQRDYSMAAEYYEKAKALAPQGENDSSIIQLTAVMNDLKSKGWL